MNRFQLRLIACIFGLAFTSIASAACDSDAFQQFPSNNQQSLGSFCVSKTFGIYSNANQGTWVKTTSLRDVDRDGYIDGFYDTQHDLTWSLGLPYSFSGGYLDSQEFREVVYTDSSGKLVVVPLTFADEASAGTNFNDRRGQPGVQIGLFNLPGVESDRIFGWYKPSLGSSDYQNLFQATLGNDGSQFLVNAGPFHMYGNYPLAWFDSGPIIRNADGQIDFTQVLSAYDIRNARVITDTYVNFLDIYGFDPDAFGVNLSVHKGDVFGADSAVPYNFSYLQGTLLAPAVPEPSSVALMCAGLLGLAVARKKMAR